MYNSDQSPLPIARSGRLRVSLILDEHALDVISHSAEQTRRLGARLGTMVQPGDVICLQGELGVGKTCFVQGVGQGMGIEGPISSPSFTLVNEYSPPGSNLRLYHIDLYRLADGIRDALAIGLDEYLYSNGVCVVEWAERADDLMPAVRLTVEMHYVDFYKRGLVFRPHGARAQALLEQYRRQVFSRTAAR
jgi:tRNA threonylcarbamoyladenosine biosynthesis protein TsaE